MRRRQLPPQLTPPPRRWLVVLAAVTALHGPSAAADGAVVAPPEPPAGLVQQALPAGASASAVALDVGGDGSGRLVFGTLRTTAALSALVLIDPRGAEVWRRTPAELGVVPRSRTAQPELGDAIPLPEVQRPVPGRWQLRLERGAAGQAGRLTLSYRLLSRYTLAFWSAAESLAMGQPLLLTLRPTDMGRAVAQHAPLVVRVQPLQPGAGAVELKALQDLTGPTGARIGDEPGACFAQWRPAAPGSYVLQASWQPPGMAAPLIATRRVDVGTAQAQLRFTGLKAEGLPACVRELVLRFAVELDAAPAAGAVHGLAARLRGTQEARQFSASVKLEGRSTEVELRLQPSSLHALGWPLVRIESSQLTRFTPDFKLLQTGGPVDLAGMLPRAAFCP